LRDDILVNVDNKLYHTSYKVIYMGLN